MTFLLVFSVLRLFPVCCRAQRQMQKYGKFSKNLYLAVSKFNYFSWSCYDIKL